MVSPAVHSAVTATAPCSPGYPASVAAVVAWPALPRLAGAAEESGPVLARCASISLARPVSIISAPAPTVTITTAGTPIRAACQARRRRAPVPADGVPAPVGRGAGQEVRRGGARRPHCSHSRHCL